jgi:hypothetical protein
MIIYVLDDGETYTLAKPIELAVTPEQLTRIEGGEKVYNVLPDWHFGVPAPCHCKVCTKERWDNHQLLKAQRLAMEE